MSRQASLILCGALAIGSAALVGCQTSWPPIESSRPMDNVNTQAAQDAMSLTANWAWSKYPAPGGAYLNLPGDLTRDNALAVLRGSGTPLRAITGDVGGATVYHIVRVWTRASHATVDLLIPASVAGAPKLGGGPCKTFTLQLVQPTTGGAWQIVDVREWETALRDVPALHVIGDAPAKKAAAPDAAKESTAAADEPANAESAGSTSGSPVNMNADGRALSR